MRQPRPNRVVSAATVAVAILTLTAVPALADGSRGHTLLKAPLVGSMPAPESPVVAGINPGGAPWVEGPSKVRVREDGRLTVKIRSLVIPPPTGTGVNPIASVVATLVCADVVEDSTEPFGLTAGGDGSTDDVISVTPQCDEPVVLIQPAGNRRVYIASTLGDDD